MSKPKADSVSIYAQAEDLVHLASDVLTALRENDTSNALDVLADVSREVQKLRRRIRRSTATATTPSPEPRGSEG